HSVTANTHYKLGASPMQRTVPRRRCMSDYHGVRRCRLTLTATRCSVFRVLDRGSRDPQEFGRRGLNAHQRTHRTGRRTSFHDVTDTVTGPPRGLAASRMVDGTRNTRPGEAGQGNVFRPMTLPSWRAVTFGTRMRVSVHIRSRWRAGAVSPGRTMP